MAVTINGDTGIDKVVDNTITTDDIQDGAITAAKIASGAIPNSYAGMKNLIINGNMQIAQRSTSVTGITGSGYKTVDRWINVIGTAGTWTQSQDTDNPSGQGFATSMKLDCTTANASLSAGSLVVFQQGIEGQNLQQLKKGTSNAEPVTLSFWVKSNKTGTYIAELEEQDNSRSISASYTINSADTWEKKTITFIGDTTGVIDNDNGKSLALNLALSAGTTFTSGTLQTSWGSVNNADRWVGQVNLADSTSNYINITGVQLEVGDTATDFENLQYGTQLALCQRYYQTNFAGSWGQAYNAATAIMGIKFHQPMRTTPSISQKSGITRLIDIIGGTQTPTNITLGSSGSNTQVTTLVSGLSGRTTWQAVGIFDTGTEFNAEL